MKSMKFFAVALLLSGAMVQAACNTMDCSKTKAASCSMTKAACDTDCAKTRGMTKVAVGCGLGAIREMAPAGLMRSFVDAVAATNLIDGAADICCKSKPAAKKSPSVLSLDGVTNAARKACILMASCWAAGRIQADVLSHAPAGLADVVTKTGPVGNLALAMVTYGACNAAVDAVLPADADIDNN